MSRRPIWEEGAAPEGVTAVGRPWLVYEPASGWHLLFSAQMGDTWQICHAVGAGTEPGGFRPVGTPLAPGQEGSGEDAAVRSPCGLPEGGGRILVVYAGFSRAEPSRPSLFHARVVSGAPTPVSAAVPGSRVGSDAARPTSPVTLGDRRARDVAWERLGLLLPAGRRGDADAGGCDHPALLQVGSRHWLWYTADDGLGRGCRLAAASADADGRWRRHGVVLGRGAPGQPDEAGAEAPGAVTSGGRIEMVYTGRASAGTRLLRARSRDGLSFDRLGPLAAAGPREGSLAFGPDGRCWLAAVVGQGLAFAPVDL